MAAAPPHDTRPWAAAGVAEIRSRALVDAMPGSILGSERSRKPDPLAAENQSPPLAISATGRKLCGCIGRTDRPYGAIHCGYDNVPLGPSGPPAVILSRAAPPVIEPFGRVRPGGSPRPCW